MCIPISSRRHVKADPLGCIHRMSSKFVGQISLYWYPSEGPYGSPEEPRLHLRDLYLKMGNYVITTFIPRRAGGRVKPRLSLRPGGPHANNSDLCAHWRPRHQEIRNNRRYKSVWLPLLRVIYAPKGRKGSGQERPAGLILPLLHTAAQSSITRDRTQKNGQLIVLPCTPQRHVEDS